MNWMAFITGAMGLFFAGAVFERYRQRRGMHLLAWAFGALLYGLAALAEALLSQGFSVAALKIWYLGGAMLTAPWLGQGTIYLLERRRYVAPVLGAILLVLTFFSLELLRAAPVDLSAGFDLAAPLSEQYRHILIRNGVIVALTIILNIYGTLALAGGAIYSAYLFWRKQVLLHRAAGNVLIAAGAILPATGGSAVLAGVADWHSLSLLLGVILLYVGYVLATPAQDNG